jgi:hypothetical protein
MPDRNGTPLSPGDPVLHSSDIGVSMATVLRKVDDGYLIQIDPPRRLVRPRHPSPAVVAILDQVDAIFEEARRNDIDLDTQEPFVVPGSALTYIGSDFDDDDGD